MPAQLELIRRVRALCRDDPRVACALQYGSFVRGEGDAFSDVEFHVFCDDEALERLVPADWIAGVAPPLATFVNEYGTWVAVFPDLVRGEFHFEPLASLEAVSRWRIGPEDVEPMLVSDRDGRLRAALERAARRGRFRPPPGHGAELVDRLVNWLLLGSHVLRRGEEARALDALGRAHVFLLWLARMAEGALDHWPTPSRALERDLSAQTRRRLARCTAPLERRALLRAYGEAWAWARELAGRVAPDAAASRAALFDAVAAALPAWGFGPPGPEGSRARPPAPAGRSGDLPLAGRVALVTGVSRRIGIGAALVRRLLADGARVYATGWPPHDAEMPWADESGRPGEAQALLAELGGEGEHLVWEEVDLADPAAPARLVEATHARFGALDIVVANHARSSLQDLAALRAEELDLCWAVNVRATILLAKALAERRDPARPGGRLILFTSGQHIGPMPRELPYAATKGALHQLTASLADALADLGITVNCVNPGPVDTGYADPATHARVAAMFPAGRWGQPEDVARLVAWLVSDEAAWLTAQVVDHEGGFRRWARRDRAAQPAGGR